MITAMLKTLFDTPADLKAYERYRPSSHQGKSYLNAFALSEDAEDLILGVCLFVITPLLLIHS